MQSKVTIPSVQTNNTDMQEKIGLHNAHATVRQRVQATTIVM